jgi:hypothetical protein
MHEFGVVEDPQSVSNFHDRYIMHKTVIWRPCEIQIYLLLMRISTGLFQFGMRGSVRSSLAYLTAYVCMKELYIAELQEQVTPMYQKKSNINRSIFLFCQIRISTLFWCHLQVVCKPKYQLSNSSCHIFCGLVVRVSGYRSRGAGFDSRLYQIF